ncbi:MAG: sigma-70 family RNA polymerase sigma factor [Aureliella sp.]
MHHNQDTSTSTSLLNQVRGGDEIAWYRMVDVYTPLIAKWSGQYGIRGADADDIAQDVFISVAKHIAEFGQDRSDNSFRAWLWTITRSKIVDQLRQAKKHPGAIGGQNFGELEAPDRNSFEARGESESVQDLNVLIASALETIRRDFTPQTWTAFWQSTAFGRRPSEIARELNMTAAAVCMCRARVLRRLRETS